MKVKIDDTYYDSEDVPIMIVFEPREKELVRDMRDEDTRFCVFPEGTDRKKISAWMAE